MFHRIVYLVTCLALIAAAAAPTAVAAPNPGPALTTPRSDLQQALTCNGDLSTAHRKPVLLVHGTFADSEINWNWNYKQALPARGEPACTVDLPNLSAGDIQVSTEYVVYAIRAMARESGGGTRFGAVLDATCDRISDGAVFGGLLWWAAFGLDSPRLVVATLICLVTSQIISYIKARAEASGLRGGSGIIERPERLIIVLAGAGLSDLPFYPLPWALHIAMWVLAVASLITIGQRLHTVRTSPGAMDKLNKPETSER